jgi:hypothetical protein
MSIIGQDVYSSVELRCPKEYLGTQYGGETQLDGNLQHPPKLKSSEWHFFN